MSCNYCDNYKYRPDYNYVKCGTCGAVTLDSGNEWGIGKRMSFKNMDFAKFYIDKGYRAEADKRRNDGIPIDSNTE